MNVLWGHEPSSEKSNKGILLKCNKTPRNLEFPFLNLAAVLQESFTFQGKSECIKNFSYRRHIATLNHLFIWILVLLLPLALVPQFTEIGNGIVESHPLVGDLFVWFSNPFYVVVAWIFHTMKKLEEREKTHLKARQMMSYLDDCETVRE